jgi:hypothetical protein
VASQRPLDRAGYRQMVLALQAGLWRLEHLAEPLVLSVLDEDKESHWLPAPANGLFNLVVHVFWPHAVQKLPGSPLTRR